MIDLAALKEAALAATPGPWSDGGGAISDFNSECHMTMEWIANGGPPDDDDLNLNETADSRYLSMVDPQTILELIRMIEEKK